MYFLLALHLHFLEAFTNTSEILEDVHPYFLPLTPPPPPPIPDVFLSKASSLQAGTNLSQNISHENGLKLFNSMYNKETFVQGCFNNDVTVQTSSKAFE